MEAAVCRVTNRDFFAGAGPVGTRLTYNGCMKIASPQRRWLRRGALMFAPLLAIVGCGGPPVERAERPPTDVTVVEVRHDEIAVQVSAVGTVVPVDVSRVAARGNGRVKRFPLREGAKVKANDVLAELQTETISIEIKAAQARLQEKQQELALREAGFRAEEIAQSEARMLAAEAVYRRAVGVLERRQQLHEQGSITDDELDEATFSATRYEQLHAESVADYELKRAGNRKEDIEAARAAVAAQEQETARLQEELRKKTIHAPFDGYLVEKHTDVGEWVAEGGTVATVARLDEIEVEVQIDEQYIDQIRLGETVDVMIDAIGPQPRGGTILAIVPRSNWQQGSHGFPVIVRLKNEFVDGSPRLKEGMIARITFRGTPHDALLAHKDAIVRSSGQPTVYVVEADSKIRGVPVSEGLSDGSYIEIFGEVAAGDLLVVEGAERVHPFDRVNVLNAAEVNASQLVTEPPKSQRPETSGGE